MARVLILLSMIFFSVYVTEQAHFLQTDYIDKINEKATTWKAGVNFDPNTPRKYIEGLMGAAEVTTPNKDNYKMYKWEDENYAKLSDDIPMTFDARKEWSYCKTIGLVQDQGNCRASWAIYPSAAFSDRLCIATKGEFNQLMSAEELAFCCKGRTNSLNGCGGGYPDRAWLHIMLQGIVTGGDYNSGEGCAPYRVLPCPYDNVKGNYTCNTVQRDKPHKYPRQCYGDQKISYSFDHRYTKIVYLLSYEVVQQDIMTYGPIEASFFVYEDFLSYKSGVYVKTENSTYVSAHSVKLIGWGEEFGVPYWLMANTWGTQWGDNGLFKIIRGTDECAVDNSGTAGVPKFSLPLYQNNIINKTLCIFLFD